MKEPTAAEYIIIVFCCLCLAVIGLFFLANFGRMFKGRIRNELLRQNVVVTIIIFFLSNSLAPVSGGFAHAINKFGWLGFVGMQVFGSIFYTLVAFNITRLVANNKKLKTLSFVQHKLLILVVLIITSTIVNLIIV